MENINISTRSLTGSRNVLSTISTWVMLIVAGLLPFFFIPSSIFPFAFTKVILLSIGTLLPLLLWLISGLKVGKLELPKGYLFASALAVPVVYLLASLFSGVMKISIIGQGNEMDTFVGILLLSLVFFLVPIFFNRHEKLTKISERKNSLEKTIENQLIAIERPIKLSEFFKQRLD